MAEPSTTSRVRQAGAFAGGFAVSSGASAALAYAASRAIGMGVKLSPAFARVAASVLSAPVVVTAAGAGAVYGGVKAAREGKSAGGIALDTLGGAASLGFNIAADAITSARAAEPSDRALKKVDRHLEAAERGLRRVDRLDLEQRLKAMTPAELKSYQQQIGATADGIYGRATLEAAFAHENRTAAANALPSPSPSPGPGTPAQPAPPAAPPNPFDKRREALETELRQLQGELAKETSRGGYGAKAEKITERIKQIQTTDLPKVDSDQQSAPSAEKTAWALGMSAGALVGGALFGGMLGKGAVKTAEKAAATAAKGIEQVAKNAGKLASSSPKGMIAGTPAGDQARAAVAAAQSKIGERVVTNAAAFGIPALNIAHGTASVVASGSIEDKTVSAAIRTEGMFAIAAGVVGAKYGIVARAITPNVSAGAQAKLQSAAARLAREGRTGPAGVAQASGRAKVAVADGKASVAKAQAQSALAAQQVAGDIAGAKGAAAVKLAKVQGAAAVSQARTSAAIRAAQLSRQQVQAAAQAMAAHRLPPGRPANPAGPRGWTDEARIASAMKRGVALPGTGPRAGRVRAPSPRK